MFFKKGVLKLKNLSVLQSLFNKVSDLQVCSFIKETPAQVLSCK